MGDTVSPPSPTKVPGDTSACAESELYNIPMLNAKSAAETATAACLMKVRFVIAGPGGGERADVDPSSRPQGGLSRG
jgi:hypothetical protein